MSDKAEHKRLCGSCGIRSRQYVRKHKGKKYYAKLCLMCRRHPNLGDKAKITYCRGCAKDYPVAVLDVDHINSDSSDNRYENLQILCSNCHRLKTHLCKDNRVKNKR